MRLETLPMLQKSKGRDARRFIRMALVWILVGGNGHFAVAKGPDHPHLSSETLRTPTLERPPIIVAVIDTGADLEHPALREHLWKNPGETGRDAKGRDKSTNGVDDDGNGLVDDLHGWNFVDHNLDVSDHLGHGTHIAGLVTKASGESLSPRVQIMILKYFDPKDSGEKTLRKSIQAMRYALDSGAHIVNYSGGGPDSNSEEFKILQQLTQKGVLVVAAAGNERADTSHSPFFPASYPLQNLLSVAATDPRGRLVSSSNYSDRSVHIAAPGFQVRSALPGGGEGPMTGTSQATAVVTHWAARIWSENSGLTAPEVRRRLLNTSLALPNLRGRVVGQNFLFGERAIQAKSERQAIDGSILE